MRKQPASPRGPAENGMNVDARGASIECVIKHRLLITTCPGRRGWRRPTSAACGCPCSWHRRAGGVRATSCPWSPCPCRPCPARRRRTGHRSAAGLALHRPTPLGPRVLKPHLKKKKNGRNDRHVTLKQRLVVSLYVTYYS